MTAPPKGDPHWDGLAIDNLADLFRLPEWRVHDSGASFIEACAEIVGRVRDIENTPAPRQLVIDVGQGWWLDEEDESNEVGQEEGCG